MSEISFYRVVMLIMVVALILLLLVNGDLRVELAKRGAAGDADTHLALRVWAAAQSEGCLLDKPKDKEFF